ncbi:DUF2789 domain-containing protein [Aestuariicella sp. G3-2]|uniref:DUF2789 domain-containing protein n=1 Tax=Pseudomaricurvus albidus TaxID=2842452 RepID=UPI001C0B1DE3|nr:DUF2789 domain-containing protein [Aestuariicella albida]MBU3069542.1 DUF2789 domain-containing protein [Aestuariicella albida]
MDTSLHSMNSLFQQLGLPHDDEDIETFITRHRLDQGQMLSEATFWSPNQARFLKEAVEEDADWAEVVDQLDARLRH